jgi:spermidine synthase
VPGDARLTLAKSAGKFDLLVLDAFSSDSVPMHLLTVEAIALFKKKLKPGGIIAYHISNRYLELKENVTAAAISNGMVARYQLDVTIPEEDDEGKTPSQWMIIARKDEDFGPLLESNRWEEIPVDATIEPWRDDFSNLLEAFLRKKEE